MIIPRKISAKLSMGDIDTNLNLLRDYLKLKEKEEAHLRATQEERGEANYGDVELWRCLENIDNAKYLIKLFKRFDRKWRKTYPPTI